MIGTNVRQRGGREENRPMTIRGKLGASLFLFFFFAMGLLFEVFVLHEVVVAVRQLRWKQVPCEIVSSEVEEQSGDTPYVFSVRYDYEYDERTYPGTIYRRKYTGSENYSEAQEAASEFPAGKKRFCYVNPGAPAEAVLKRNSLLILPFALFPLIFIVIGAGGIYFVWRKAPPERARPIAAIAAGRRGKRRYALAGFFAIFAIVGGALFYPLGIRPIARTLDAESWVETPCRVLRAEVRSHDSDDGTTYSAYILYQYDFEGQTYKSDRFDFIGGSSSGYKGKARTVALYESAADPVCYVNPDDPSEAVLKRGWHAKLLLALFPLPFLLVGVGGVIGTLRHKKKTDPATGLPLAGRRRNKAASPESILTLPETGSVTLKPKHSPSVRLIGAIVITAFWNGIVLLPVLEIIEGFRQGSPSWFLTLFMIPFVLIGLVLFGMIPYQLMALFNPRPTVHLSSARLPLGGAAELGWKLAGSTGRVRELTVQLRGVEEARYTRGTDTYTDRNTFYEMELYKTTDPAGVASGQVGFLIPQETMHSFEAENNKILWSVDLHGQIDRWPDVKESYKITVTPAAVEGSMA